MEPPPVWSEVRSTISDARALRSRVPARVVEGEVESLGLLLEVPAEEVAPSPEIRGPREGRHEALELRGEEEAEEAVDEATEEEADEEPTAEETEEVD